MNGIPGIPIDTTADAEAFIGIAEVSELTGYSRKNIYRLCEKNQIPHYQHRPRAALLFLVSEVRAWLKEGGQ